MSDDLGIWQWIGQNLWMPLSGLVVALISIVRHSDLGRMNKLEAAVAAAATKEEVARIEALAQNAVYEKQFREFVERVEQSRKELRTEIAIAFSEIKHVQEVTAQKIEHLTERVIASGFVRDERSKDKGGR